jgi:N-methylhydantoinase A
VTISSDVSPEFREYERSATVVMNAYTMPKIDALVRRLDEVLQEEGFAGAFSIMQSNGGIMSIRKARAQPVNTLLSGPAGGVVGAAAVAQASGVGHILGFDVGGTSTDIALVENGEIRLAAEGGIAGYPVRVPQVGVHTIGAGGGSIAAPVLGMLKVGPQSAGADPGPACYGLGGTEPTGTDAAVALGYIDPDYFVGGEIKLDREAARTAIRARVAEPLGLELDRAALAIIEVQVATIVAGIRKVSVEAGKDPRDFSLLPFGGAGGLYAALVAQEAGMTRILLPRHPSVLSALGMLMTDIRHHAVLTRLARLDDLDGMGVRAAFGELVHEGAEALAREGAPAEDRRYALSCDMRYVGQAYEINIPLSLPPGDGTVDLAALRASFDAEHNRLYGQSSPRESVEVVGYRVEAIGRVDKAELAPLEPRRTAAPTPRTRRPVLLDAAAGWIECPIFERSGLATGDLVPGPAIVEDRGSSFVLREGHELAVDAVGNLMIQRAAAAHRLRAVF